MARSPTASSTEQGFSRWVAKAPRMRSACTQCHAAKIRCSGEKTGCQRCTNLGLHCEYVVSMVGRTPKRQRKTADGQANGAARPSPPERQPSEASLPRSAYPVSRASTTEAPLSVAGTAATADPQGAAFDMSRTIFVSPTSTVAPTDFTDDQLFDCLNDDSWMSGGAAHCPTLTTATTTLDDGLSFPELCGFEIENFSLPSDLQPATTTTTTSAAAAPSFLTMAACMQQPQVPPPPPPPSLSSGISSFLPISPRSPGTTSVAPAVAATLTQRGAQDWTQFAHIVALCKMIRLLEHHVQTQSMAVDEVMKLSQACIRDITRISSRKESMQCKSCPALISTIMELIVTLYEDTTRITTNADSQSSEQQQQGQQQQGQQSSSSSSSPGPAGTAGSATHTNGTTNTTTPTTNNTTTTTTAPAAPCKVAATPFLQFGVFELDPEEQAAIRNRIIRKQAQECVQIIQDMKRLLDRETTGGVNGGSPPASGAADESTNSQTKALRDWYEGMEKRMDDLISHLTTASC